MDNCLNLQASITCSIPRFRWLHLVPLHLPCLRVFFFAHLQGLRTIFLRLPSLRVFYFSFLQELRTTISFTGFLRWCSQSPLRIYETPSLFTALQDLHRVPSRQGPARKRPFTSSLRRRFAHQRQKSPVTTGGRGFNDVMYVSSRRGLHSSTNPAQCALASVKGHKYVQLSLHLSFLLPPPPILPSLLLWRATFSYRLYDVHMSSHDAVPALVD